MVPQTPRRCGVRRAIILTGLEGWVRGSGGAGGVDGFAVWAGGEAPALPNKAPAEREGKRRYEVADVIWNWRQ